MPDNPNARRSHNRKLALQLVEAGLYVFPSSGKVPLALAWERSDTSIGTDQAAQILNAAKQKAEAKGKQFDDKTFVGCTKDPNQVKEMFRRHPDAVPSISLGPSKLYVLDADIDELRNGPKLLRRWLADNNIDISACPITTSQSGGEHVYFKGDDLRSHIGDTLKALYVQAKSKGNQVVAPGAWREDGKRYRSDPNQPGLLSTYALDELPTVPTPLVALQHERSEQSIDDQTTADIIAQSKLEPRDDISDPEVGIVDIPYLASKDEEFKNLIDDPSPDTSHNRFTYLKCLQREYADKLTPADYLFLLQDYDGSGEFVGDQAQKQGEWNYRNFARDFANSKTQWRISDGSSFGDVKHLDEEYVPAHYLEAKAEKAERNANKVWKLEYLDDLQAGYEPIEWLVENLIEVGTLGIPYGPPGAGKSAWAIDLLMRIAHGLPWQGRKTRKGAVLYIAQEGMKGSKRRVQAWQKWADDQLLDLDDNAPFVMVRRQINLFANDADAKEIRKAVKEIETRTGFKVVAIVVDTLRACLVGGDENKQSDTSVIMDKLNRLCISTGAAIMALHHTGKDVERGASGNTNIIGSADWSLEITKGKVRTRKVRDADDDQKFGFRTLGIEVGHDNMGQMQQAVVVEACELKEEVKKKAVSKKTAEQAFGDVSGQDAENEAESRLDPVSDRSRAIAAGVAEAIAGSIVAGDVKSDAMGYFPAIELAQTCEALAEMSGPNMARKLKSKVFGNEVRVLTSLGWLEYDPAKGRRGARFKIQSDEQNAK